MSRMAQGVCCVILGALFWGFSGTCAQALFARYDIAPLFLASVRMVGAGLLYLCLLLARYREQLKALLADKRALLRVAAFGCGGLFLSQITYLLAIRYTNSGT
ncbi:MAG: EamA family transporter, partial [Coriobacteriales bacterium]|nr:EamA family transporter [Coriobacteriales bacterium]